MIPEDKKQEILTAAKIYDIVSDVCSLKKSGSSFITPCPKCGATGKGKGLIVTPAKNLAKCFSCDWSPNAVNFLMETQKINYPEALRYLADKYKIELQTVARDKIPGRQSKKDKNTFCHKQLVLSGLTEEDITAKVWVDDETTKDVECFEAGTLDQYANLTTGDDMIIWYYDLEGKPVMYQKPKSNKMEPLFRVRWQNPDLHLDKTGVPMKYRSPYGSGSHLYIPDRLRQIYKDRRQIKRLFIQEGEKKAEKACKHGVPSVGIMGINNIGRDGKLPYELQLIIQACNVEEVIFMIDLDWDQLSTHISANKRADQRPWNFYYAVKNFKEYFRTFETLDIYLELYFAHVKPNEKNDKGFDDLLTNTLAGKENQILADITRALTEKDGSGQYIDAHKITTISDGKLLEFWSLNSAETFAQRYKNELKELREFRIGKHKWRFNDQDQLELAQPLQEDEQFWEKYTLTDSRGNDRIQYRFRYMYAYNFFKKRGYGRIMMASGQFQFCHVENRIVKLTEAYQIKDFAMELAKEIVPSEEKVDVMDMLYRGGKMYFGPDSLSNVDFVTPTFEIAEKGFQILFFKEKFWKITANEIKEQPMTELQHYVWSDKINDFDAHLVPGDMIKVQQITNEFIGRELTDGNVITEEFVGQYAVELSPEAWKSHFVQFLWNTGEFFWQKFIHLNGGHRQPKQDERNAAEMFETNLHFMSKVTAIGFLLHQFFDKSKAKAVIGMDGKLSEVGSSWGGTGKSILGDAIGKVIPQVAIGAKNKKLTEDPFWAEEVTEKTDHVFLDDVRANIDFEFFFPYITGKFTVNPKGGRKFTIPEKDTPKIYLSTNHAIVGEGSSFKRRQFFIAFSDFYNENHIPTDDFGVNFFDEWDQVQWNLFYNFMANCLKVYFQYGLIEAPTERLELRRLRQQIGEDFLAWADEYFSYDEAKGCFISGPNINQAKSRKELYDDYILKYPAKAKFTTPTKFKKKMVFYCLYRKAAFNPHKFFDAEETRSGADDKTGGVEYFTIANSNYSAAT
jgi:DNA primase